MSSQSVSVYTTHALVLHFRMGYRGSVAKIALRAALCGTVRVGLSELSKNSDCSDDDVDLRDEFRHAVMPSCWWA